MKKRLAGKTAWAAASVLAMALWLGGCAASANPTDSANPTAAGTEAAAAAGMQTQAVTEAAADASTEAQTQAVTEPAAESQNPAAGSPAGTDAAGSQNPGSGAAGQTGEWIGEDRAREIALAQAEGANPNVFELYQDWDDGRTVYEGEMVDDSYRYEFELDAATGDVLQWEREGRRGIGTGNSGQNLPGAENAIGMEAASSIALEQAQAANPWIVEIWLELDDGRLVYEGEMRDDSYEYDFELDAATGEVVQWETETLRR